MVGDRPIEPPAHDRTKRPPKLHPRRPSEPRDPRLVEIVRRLVRACGADPSNPDWRVVHAALVAETQHVWRVRKKTARLPPWPGDAAFTPGAVRMDDLGGALPPPVNWRRAALRLALDLAAVLSRSSGRGRPSTDPARRELRDALRALQVEGLGPPIGPTDESRMRDRWAEQHARDHGRTEVKREDFAALLAELVKGQLSHRYRLDEYGRFSPCDPRKSWQKARELYISLGGKPEQVPDKPPRYSRKGVEIRSIGHEGAADTIDDLWRCYRDRRGAPPGGSLFRAVSVLADLEWAAAELTRKGE